jgi:23S rRNA (cytosine1962-C5)-methyltransferase
MNKINLITSTEKDYELLDSGRGQKLERFGRFVLSRPDPQALWKKNLSGEEWAKADGVFSRVGDKYDDSDGKGNANNKKSMPSTTIGGETSSKNQEKSKGRWKLKASTPEKWQINFAGLKFFIEPTPFKHVGLFPEQKGNWEWMKEKVKGATADTSFGSAGGGLGEPSGRVLGMGNRGVVRRKNVSVEAPKILNLFGYTGGASLACAQAGASVVHVDGSKVALTRAKENAELSGLADKPIRWILDDARDFVKRELRRGKKYHGIIMDPPSFGRGDKGQVWKIEDDFLSLFNDCLQLLSDKPIFFLINGYAAGYSPIAYYNNLKILQEKFGGEIESGELVIREEMEKGHSALRASGPMGRKGESRGSNGSAFAGKASADRGNKPHARFLPCGIFARWSI